MVGPGKTGPSSSALLWADTTSVIIFIKSPNEPQYCRVDGDSDISDKGQGYYTIQAGLLNVGGALATVCTA